MGSKFVQKIKLSMKKRPWLWLFGAAAVVVGIFALVSRPRSEADREFALAGYPRTPEPALPASVMDAGVDVHGLERMIADIGMMGLEEDIRLYGEIDRRFAQLQAEREERQQLALEQQTVLAPQQVITPQQVLAPSASPAPAPVFVAVERPYLPAVVSPAGDVISPAIRITEPVPVHVAQAWDIVRPIEQQLREQEAVRRQDPVIGAQVRALEADIARVEARRHDPATIAYFNRQHGGIEAYLASQRARLAALR